MCSGKRPRILQMHTTVTESTSDETGGSIVCTPMGNEPISYEWFDANNRPILQQETKNELHHLKAGDYYVVATDAVGDVAKIRVKVRPSSLPSVVGYDTVNASSRVARDGRVTGHVHPSDLTDVRFLWTTGAITDDPVLLDVFPGEYVVTIISKDENTAIPFVHATNPAHVGVSLHE